MAKFLKYNLGMVMLAILTLTLMAMAIPAHAADSYTPNLRIVQMPTGSNDTQWGTKANAAFAMLEQAISQGQSISVTAGGTITLTTANNATDQSRNAEITFTGTPAGSVTIVLPTVSKLTWVNNTSSQTLVFNSGAGTNASVTAGSIAMIYTDGAGNTSALANISSFGASLMNSASAAAAQSTLGLGSAATQSTSTFLQASNNLVDLANTATARSNLGLGSAATQNTTAFDAAGAASSAQAASLQKSSNLSDVANAGTARSNLGLGSGATANITISTSGPSGGNNGDLWVVY